MSFIERSSSFFALMVLYLFFIRGRRVSIYRSSSISSKIGSETVSYTHLMQNLIEGQLDPKAKVVVVEDLISTGGSSLVAVLAEIGRAHV